MDESVKQWKVDEPDQWSEILFQWKMSVGYLSRKTTRGTTPKTSPMSSSRPPRTSSSRASLSAWWVELDWSWSDKACVSFFAVQVRSLEGCRSVRLHHDRGTSRCVLLLRGHFGTIFRRLTLFKSSSNQSSTLQTFPFTFTLQGFLLRPLMHALSPWVKSDSCQIEQRTGRGFTCPSHSHPGGQWRARCWRRLLLRRRRTPSCPSTLWVRWRAFPFMTMLTIEIFS